MKQHNYFIYITTNPARTVLYIGVTNDLATRLLQHFEERGREKTFAGRYFCFNLIYYERFTYIQHAINREKEIKKMEKRKERGVDQLFQSKLEIP